MQEVKQIHVLDSGHLNHPLEVRRKDPVLVEPAGKLSPLIRITAIDGQTGLCILVSGILQVTGNFL